VLLRGLRRFEIVPAGDLALRKSVTWSLGRKRLLTERQVRAAVRRWAPYAGLIAYRTLHAHRQTVG
jgi:3-methyladenine DNA glycosylase/8-oxoguanine DNA glycosylase